MARKPDIQYVGQFYVYGSEAKELAAKPLWEKAKTKLPKPKLPVIHKLYVDPVAILGVTVAVVMLIVMLIGAVELKESWNEYYTVSSYLFELRYENVELEHAYHASYDLAEVQSTATATGMIPVSQVKTTTIKVTVPELEPEPTAWDDFIWFLSGLFA